VINPAQFRRAGLSGAVGIDNWSKTLTRLVTVTPVEVLPTAAAGKGTSVIRTPAKRGTFHRDPKW
jgi:hypothetical protein